MGVRRRRGAGSPPGQLSAIGGQWPPAHFVETKVFTQDITRLLSDDDYRDLQEALARRPDRGALVVGTGGARKVRWRAEGRGKRGGVRVIYYFRLERREPGFYMLLAFAKNEQSTLTAEQMKYVREAVKEFKK